MSFRRDERKDEWTQQYLRSWPGGEGVLYIGRAQEKARVLRTERRHDPRTGATYSWLVESTAFVNHYYLYAVDDDFGPFFLKFCSYFPYKPSCAINGHEYLKRQLTKRGIAFEALDNGILRCADPRRMQRLADGLTAKQLDYATANGSAQAGTDYTAASGTLTFQAGEPSKTIDVYVLDDAHDEGKEALTLTLTSPSLGRLTDSAATGTIENQDPLRRALLARFGHTAAVHIVEQVEERVTPPREPGFRGELAGRELRRGMEREMALSLLNGFGGLGGGNHVAGNDHGSMTGAQTGGTTALGTPGAASSLMGSTSGLGGAAGAFGRPAGRNGGLLGGGLLQMGLGG